MKHPPQAPEAALPREVRERPRLTRNRLASKAKSAAVYKSFVWKLLRLLLLVGLSFVILYPFLVKLSTAFMSRQDIMDSTVRFIPRHPTLENIQLVIEYTDYWVAFANTLLVSLVCAVIQTFICTMVGYGLAKFRFRGRGLVFALVIATIVIPPQTIMVSLYMKFRYFDIFGILQALGLPTLQLNDSLIPMVLLSGTGLGLKNGLYIFVMRQFFLGVPDELGEAAQVDGATAKRSFFQIMLPLATPMMVTIFLLSFSWQWTDTFYSSLLFAKMKLLPNIVFSVQQISQAGIFQNTMMSSVLINTAAPLVVFPLIIFYLFAQKKLVQGIERSGLVG